MNEYTPSPSPVQTSGPIFYGVTPKQMRHASIEVKFWSRVRKGLDTQCWPWTGRTDARNRGIIYYDGKQRIASRVAYILTHGPIPDNRFVCHSCDNPNCCNPAHLWLGTPKDNTQDMILKGRNIPGAIQPIPYPHPNIDIVKQAICDTCGTSRNVLLRIKTDGNLVTWSLHCPKHGPTEGENDKEKIAHLSEQLQDAKQEIDKLRSALKKGR